MVKFDTGIFCLEVPIGFGVAAIAVVLPSGDFRDESLPVGDAAVEHCEDRTPSSDSAKSSQLPCFGV